MYRIIILLVRKKKYNIMSPNHLFTYRICRDLVLHGSVQFLKVLVLVAIDNFVPYTNSTIGVTRKALYQSFFLPLIFVLCISLKSF